MRRAIASALVFGLSICVSSLVVAQQPAATNGNQYAVSPEIEVPNDIRSDGSFRYSVPLDLPDFRGLEPNLGVRYSSSFKGHGNEESWLGVGWQLTGFSSIERVSLGFGIPTFDDNFDLFRLDGMELLACDDTGATNPWAGTYPDRYKTEAASASCAAGGNFSTLVESYRKIERLVETAPYAGIDRFVVTSTQGIKYTYRAIGVLAGDTANPQSDDYDFLFKRKFLLTEIADTQATANTVQFEYGFTSVPWGRLHRPLAIEYANGYKVEFLYNWLSEPIATVAVGSDDYIGRQTTQLDTIKITDSGNPIRGYAFEYENAPMTGIPRLSRMRAYGSDYTIDGGGYINGGSQLPSPFKGLVYNTDLPSLTEETFNRTFHRGFKSFDIAGDGKNDLIFTTDRFTEVGYCFPNPSGYGHYEIETDSAGARTIQNGPDQEFFGQFMSNEGYKANFQSSGSASQIIGFAPATDDLSNSYVFARRQNWLWEAGGFLPDGGPEIVSYGLNPTTQASVLAYNVSQVTTHIGNYDKDAETELILGGTPSTYTSTQIYDFNGTSLTATGVGWPRFSTNFDTASNIDLDGDGMQEELFHAADPVGGGYNPLPPGGPWRIADHRGGQPVQTSIPVGDVRFGSLVLPADVNGDGNQDLIYLKGNEGIYVSISLGNTFLPATLWLAESASAALQDVYSGGDSNALSAAGDVNGDGLDDLIVHGGFRTEIVDEGCPESVVPYGSRNAYIFLSKGQSFVDETLAGLPALPGYIGLGDFDGNGLSDAAIEGPSQGKIHFSDGPVANLLTSLTDEVGGATSVEYASSALYGNNNNMVPGISQLVRAIEIENGHGDNRRTTFTYVNNAYDYDNRRPLGYGTVTAQLPALANETTGPVVQTIYENDHIAEHGRIKTQTLIQGGQTYEFTKNTWSSVTGEGGNGPYRVTLDATENRMRYDPQLIRTYKEFEWTDFGAIEVVRDFGFINSSGSDLDPSDNTVTEYSYAQSTGNYIVSKPYKKRQNRGLTLSSDRSTWLVFDRYFYDGASVASTPPTHGNRTANRVWDGNLSGTLSTIRIDELTYDSHGNVLSYKDAEDNVSTYTYDANRHLFQLTETNPLGHVVSTSWDESCQNPLKITDANNNDTDYSYDTHCRQTRVDFVNGDYETTAYHNFGDPQLQFVQTRRQAPTSGLGNDQTREREYFDGFGETWKVVTTGATPVVGASSVVLRKFDERGNLSWESIPLSWAASQNPGSITTSEQTRFTYDPLGRVTRTDYADGRYATSTYAPRWVYAGNPHPSVTVKNAHCFDGNTNTTCEEVLEAMDARGNTIRRILFDTLGTDADVSAGDRVTAYDYDLLNRLTGITDPGGATWTYVYDSRGRRISADDPALGLWTMEYDNNDNLTKQTDAKGQTIEFSYDALNRATQKKVTWNNGAPQIDITDYTYDADNPGQSGHNNIGHLSKAENDAHRVTYGYSTRGWVRSEVHTDLATQDIYEIERNYFTSGQLKYLDMPSGTGQPNWNTPWFAYDTAGRVIALGSAGSNIDSISYNLRSQPERMDFGNGTYETYTYYPERGWLNKIEVFDPSNTKLAQSVYWRTSAGKVQRANPLQSKGKYNYCYDYAGRLLVAANLDAAGKSCVDTETFGHGGTWNGARIQDQFFTYRTDGSMKSNKLFGSYDRSYAYGQTPVAHAPNWVTNLGNLSYDANGNMTTGPNGKVMTYDGENRPLTVTLNGVTTSYIYSAEGSRWKRIVNDGGTVTTNLYVTPELEIENPAAGASSTETVHWYLHPNIRKEITRSGSQTHVMHRDQLNSLVMMTDQNADWGIERVYAPFGLDTQYSNASAIDPKPEDIGWIGERKDTAAELQYLNARYYDPELSMFIQPDWLDPTVPGVGTNRYSYSFNDPVNLRDPGGNCPSCFGAAIGAALAVATQIGLDVVNGELSSAGTYAGAALGGAVAGASFGVGTAAFGSGAVAAASLGAASGASGGLVARGTQAAIDGTPVSARELSNSAALGGGLGIFGVGIGKAIGAAISKSSNSAKEKVGVVLSTINQAVRGRIATKNTARISIPGVTTPTGRKGYFVPDLEVKSIFDAKPRAPREAKWTSDPNRTKSQMSTTRQNQARKAGLLKDSQYDVWSGPDIDRGAVSAAGGVGAGISAAAERK